MAAKKKTPPRAPAKLAQVIDIRSGARSTAAPLPLHRRSRPMTLAERSAAVSATMALWFIGGMHAKDSAVEDLRLLGAILPNMPRRLSGHDAIVAAAHAGGDIMIRVDTDHGLDVQVMSVADAGALLKRYPDLACAVFYYAHEPVTKAGAAG